MWGTILGYVMQAITVIPSLVTDVERLWANKPKAGTPKSEAVMAAIAGSIQDVAAAAAKLSPAGTAANEIESAVAVFAKDVNDAFVTLANDLKLFPHAGTPATNAAAMTPAPAAKTN